MADTTVVYGGSFNPPHLAHQAVCWYLLEGLGAQSVWLMPTAQHPFNKQLVALEHRLAMCRLLAAPMGERVSTREDERNNPSGRTYTLLEHLVSTHPGRRFALAVGSDILQETDAWHRWDDLVRDFEVVVVGRQGYPVPPHPSGRPPFVMPDLSSTTIRERLARGASIEGWVPLDILHYIERERLYRPSAPEGA